VRLFTLQKIEKIQFCEVLYAAKIRKKYSFVKIFTLQKLMKKIQFCEALYAAKNRKNTVS